MKTKMPILFVIIFFIAILIILVAYLAKVSYNPYKKIIYGVTFSKSFAKYLDLDWRQTYIAVLDDLQVKYIRIPILWNEIEPEKNLYNFEDIDWQVAEAEKRNAHLISSKL